MMLPPAIDVIVDSAVVLPGKPLFLPDFDLEWMAMFYVGVRISRLGKNITPKFAPRYYDAITVAMRLVPVSIDRELRAAGRPAALVDIFDGALSIGEWCALPTDSSRPIVVSVRDSTMFVGSVIDAVNDSVSEISRYSTLKIGDVLLPLRLGASLSVKQGDNVSVVMDAREVLKVRIK